MHKVNLLTDDNSVDFDFFETDTDRKLSDNQKKYSSKIITKAVIETKPKKMSENSTSDPLKLNSFTKLSKEKPFQTKTYDCPSSPTSSEEKRLIGNDVDDITLFNCLAYNDDVDDRETFNMDDKYFSDNSLSDSTITTVTSDFTSVSHLSSMSDSSCGSDSSCDLPTSKSGGLMSNDIKGNVSDVMKDLNTEPNEIFTEKVDERNNSGDISDEADIIVFESTNPGDEFQNNNCSDQNQETDSSTPSNRESESGHSDHTKINTDSYSEDVFEDEPTEENQEHSQQSGLSRKESPSTTDIEERIGGISLASQSSSNSSMAKAHNFRGHNRFRSKRRELNLTFSREELIRIERDNTILLKKIMSYSKPRSVLLNHTFSHKKTSTAINRARQQKKIEQDNYILYSKINAMNRMKKVF